jgi:predicted DNA-binding antitoxin AbrB/MazE fold protein
MVPPLLVGMINKDMLDLEDEVVAGDTKIYVDDINQVKQMELRGITDSDVKMIDLISKGLDLTTLDPHQEGVAQKYVTARAAVSADERARQLKDIFFMFMESLWLQKVRLRIPNILLSYAMPKIVETIGEEGAIKLNEKYRLFNVDKAELSDGTKGTLGIEFRSDEDMADRKALMLDVEAEEERNFLAGKPYEKIIISYGRLEQISFDIEVIPESLWQSSQTVSMALALEKTQLIASIFPEYFSANKELLFQDLIKAYGDDSGRFELPKPMSFEQEKGLELASGVAGKSKGGSSAGGGLISDISGSDSNNPPAGV